MTAILLRRGGEHNNNQNNNNNNKILKKQHSMPIGEKHFQSIFDFQIIQSPLKPFLTDLCRLKYKKPRFEFNNRNIAEKLPEILWIRIFSYLGPLDRISLGQCSKRLNLLTFQWNDVNSLEIRPEWENELLNNNNYCYPSLSSSPSQITTTTTAEGEGGIIKRGEGERGGRGGYRRRLPSIRLKSKYLPKSFKIRLIFSSGHSANIKTNNLLNDPEYSEKILKILLCRLGGGGNNQEGKKGEKGTITELTIWDSCISERLKNCIIRCCSQTLYCLRLWNCGRWLNYSPSPLLISLININSLKQLFILDTTTITNTNTNNNNNLINSLIESSISSNSFFSSSNSSSNIKTTNSSSLTTKYIFSKILAKSINSPLEEIQLTNCHISLSAFELILLKCGESLKRLSIGYTFGKEQKRIQYLQLLNKFKKLNDLDLPPFIFHLGDQPKPDIFGQKFLKELTNLKAFGFRHFNSSSLFYFIKYYLPKNIRVLRIYHNSRRIPNFAELGIIKEFNLNNNCYSPSSLSFSTSFSLPSSSSSSQKKYSSTSSQCSLLSENNSIILTEQQIKQNNNLLLLLSSSSSNSSNCSTLSWPINSTKSFSFGPEDEQISLATSSTWCTNLSKDLQNNNEKENKIIINKKLTIFAIAEEHQITKRNKRQKRLRKNKFNGIDVIYVSSEEAQISQEVLGRMGGAPIQSPYVYTTNQNNNKHSSSSSSSSFSNGNGQGIRVIHGDLVKTIPLSSLGMESDWESDYDE